MQSARTALEFRCLCAMRHLFAVITCLVLLAGCNLGAPASLFDEDGAIKHSIAALHERIGGKVLALNVLISPDTVTIRAQNPADRSRVDEWRLTRVHMASLNWERGSGPEPYTPNLINPDLEANLFDLDGVDFSGAGKLARAALERAGLADKAQVTRMELARRTFVLPRPASGDVRWTIEVKSDQESAQIYADVGGTIIGANLDGTSRAKTLNILQKLDLVTDGARAFRYILGPDRMLLRVGVSPRWMGFETNLDDPSPPIPDSAGLKARQVFTWNLNGLQRAIAKFNMDAAFGAVNSEAFSIDDVDWTALPKIIAAARQQLGLPDGPITDIEVAKPPNPIGPSVVLWKIEIAAQNKETGLVLADTSGHVKRVMLPQSMRKPTDYYDPATMAETFVKLGVDFGKDRQYSEITFLNDKVMITAQDHMEPNVSRQFTLSENGYDRSGTSALSTEKSVPFRIDELSALTAGRIRDLEARTLDTLKLPPKSISSITIGRGSMDPSPKGNVTIEIRAEERPFGRAGRVNYELDGTVIKTYLP